MIKTNLHSLIKNLIKKYSKVQKLTFNRSGRDFTKHIKEVIENMNLVNSSELLKSVGFTLKDIHTLEIFVEAEHARFVESGLRPGNHPNIENLREWAKAKGIADESAVYKIRHKIFREGIKPQPFFEKSIKGFDKIIKDSFGQAIKEIY